MLRDLVEQINVLILKRTEKAESEYEREVRVAERRVKSKRQGSRLSLSSTLI